MYLERDDDLGTNRLRTLSAVGTSAYALGCLCFVLLSAVLFFVNTRHGIGILPDSTRYMGLAEEPYDAPVYYWLLGLTTFLGVSLEGGAKILGLLFVCANTALVWHVLSRATGRPAYAAIGSAIVVLSPQFVGFHSVAMSEPPFIFALLVTLLSLLRYVQTDRRSWLLASAVALGFATLTRFTAPPLGAAIALVLLAMPQRSLGRRLADVLLFAVVSAAIFLGWTAASQIVEGHSIGRDLRFYGNMGTKEWLTSLEALTVWLLPTQVPFALRVVALIAFVAAMTGLTVSQARAALQRAGRGSAGYPLVPAILGLFFVFYLLFMVLATALEANLSLNGRYAFPIYVTTILMATIVLASIGRSKGVIRFVHHALVCLAFIVLASNMIRTAVRSEDAFRNGVGYASTKWTQSPTMQAIRTLPTDAIIYSNGADAVSYILKRPARLPPRHLELRMGVENPSRPFDLQVNTLRDAPSQAPTYLAYFDHVDWRFYLTTEAELKELVPLVPLADEADGRLYAVQPTRP